MNTPTKHYYFVTLSYNGSAYLGWQIQNEGRTVQGTINKVLKEISKSEDVRTIGGGRTDTGVHALNQTCKIAMYLEIKPEKLILAMNSLLPPDIRILTAKKSTEEFMPTSDAKSKEYGYFFTNQEQPTPFQNTLMSNYTYKLDFKAIEKACKLLEGEHDFVNFFTKGTEVKTTVRTIFSCQLKKHEGHHLFIPAYYELNIVGSGFLKQMVRLIVGALWELGRGKITLDDFKEALEGRKLRKIGPTAPSDGLYLKHITY
ncbi:MAG: tRNA pseudouridine(38-40) synthase TruA [Bacteriovoracaceae bacterium]|nr:tRNA pseudouridine(38-40) synthase TruA [Bacteriovoracaceae bacterium]